MDSTLFLIIPGSCVLVGLVTWYLNRSFSKVSIEDPALPEKLQIHRRNVWFTVFIAFFVGMGLLLHFLKLAGFSKGHYTALIFTPLVAWMFALALMAGLAGYKNRIRIFEETWSRIEYLGFYIRLTLAFTGFWLVALIGPPQLLEMGIWGSITGIALFILLLHWTLRFPLWFCQLLQAKPLDPKSAHHQAFQEVLDRSNIDSVDVLVSGPTNGHWINAVALPSLSKPRVVMSGPLLNKLTKSEATAIFAHELAHIEDFSRAWLKRSQAIDMVAITFGCILLPGLAYIMGNTEAWMSWVWFATVIAVYVSKAKDMQKREVFADTRGLELYPHLEDFISGLTQVYSSARMPRRVQMEVDQSASHPSLARRIQELNTHAAEIGLISSSEKNSTQGTDLKTRDRIENTKRFFQSAENKNEFVIFEDDRIVRITTNAPAEENESNVTEDWIRSNAQIEQSSSYSGLLELRLLHKGKKTYLRTVESPKILRQFLLREQDIGHITRVLDTVDTKITPLNNINSQQHSAVRFALLGSAFTLFFAMTQGVVSLGAVTFFLTGSLVALVKPNRGWIAAMGGAAGLFAMSRILTQDDQSWWSQTAWILLGSTVALGVYHWYRVFKPQTEDDDAVLESGNAYKTGLLILGIGGVCTLPLFLSLQGGNTPMKLSMLSIHSHIAFLPFLCAGCALLVAPKLLSKVPGLLLILIGLSPLYLGSESFRLEVASEPLVATDAPQPSWEPVEHTELHTLSLEGDHWGIQLSPDGSRFITQTDDHQFQIHDWDGQTVIQEALALAWSDSGHCLALTEKAGTLQLIRFSPAESHHKTVVCEIEYVEIEDHFELWAQGGQWQILAGKDSATTTLISNSEGQAELKRSHWHNRQFEDTWRHKLGESHILELAWNKNEEEAQRTPFSKLHQFYYWPTYLQLLNPTQESKALAVSNLWVTANTNFEGHTRVISQSNHAAYLWNVDSATHQLNPIATLPLVTSWGIQKERLYLLSEQELRISDLNAQSGILIELPTHVTWEDEVSIQGNQVAYLHTLGEQHAVSLLEISPTPSDLHWLAASAIEDE